MMLRRAVLSVVTAGVLVGGFLEAAALGQVQPRSVVRRRIEDEPQLRERIYQRTVDHYLQSLGSAYTLTDEQTRQVSARLDQLKQEQDTYAQAHAAESSELAAKLAGFRRAQTQGRMVDEQAFQRASQRMQELWQGAPLMNPQHVLAEVEKLLPAEQAAQGHKRWEQAQRDRIQTLIQRFGRGRERWFAEEGPDSSWRRFVEAFCQQFGLDAGQQETAWSVLRDVEARKESYRTSHANNIESAMQTQDWMERRGRMEQLLAPVDQMFEELKSRLDRIPTSSQIESVRAQRSGGATTQTSVTRPAGRITTRPSDFIGPSWFNSSMRRLTTRPASQPGR